MSLPLAMCKCTVVAEGLLSSTSKAANKAFSTLVTMQHHARPSEAQPV